MAAKTDAQKKQPKAWEGAFAALGQAFDQLKRNPGPAYLYVGVYMALTAFELFMFNEQSTKFSDLMPILGLEGLFTLVFLVALPTYALAMADRKQVGVAEIMRFGLKKYLTVLAAGLLAGLIIGVSFVFLIVPAVWTIAWFAFVVLIVVDKNVGPIEALKMSKHLAKNHKGKVWGLIGASILLGIGAGIVASFPVIGQALGALFSSILGIITATGTAILYRWLQAEAK